MICLEDLVEAKEKNEKIVEDNKILILSKEKENIELEAENRVFDKLITIEKSRIENVENI